MKFGVEVRKSFGADHLHLASYTRRCIRPPGTTASSQIGDARCGALRAHLLT